MLFTTALLKIDKTSNLKLLLSLIRQSRNSVTMINICTSRVQQQIKKDYSCPLTTQFINDLKKQIVVKCLYNEMLFPFGDKTHNIFCYHLKGIFREIIITLQTQVVNKTS